MSLTASSEEAAVRATLHAYADAVFHADVDTLKKLFHPTAVMNGYLGDKLLVGSPEPFLADVGGHPAMADSDAPYTATWSAVSISGRAATATLNETGFFGAVNFVNYFHLLKVDGEWKLMSKTFESIA